MQCVKGSRYDSTAAGDFSFPKTAQNFSPKSPGSFAPASLSRASPAGGIHRGHFFMGLNTAPELFGAGIPAGRSDLLQAVFGVQQKLPCLLHSGLGDVGVDGHSHRLFKKRTERRCRIPHKLADRTKIQRAIAIMPPDIRHH